MANSRTNTGMNLLMNQSNKKINDENKVRCVGKNINTNNVTIRDKKIASKNINGERRNFNSENNIIPKKMNSFGGCKVKNEPTERKRQALGDISNRATFTQNNKLPSIFKKIKESKCIEDTPIESPKPIILEPQDVLEDLLQIDIKEELSVSSNSMLNSTLPDIDMSVEQIMVSDESACDVEESCDVSMVSQQLDKTATCYSVNGSLLPPGVKDVDLIDIKDPLYSGYYANHIFQYLKSRESKFKVSDYMKNHKSLNSNMRLVLVDWMVEVQENFELNHETLYMAIKLVDLYLNKVNDVPRQDLQLIGSATMLISSKFDERCPPALDDYVFICDDTFTRESLITKEIEILTVLGFDIGVPISYRFLRRFSNCAEFNTESLYLARFILESSLLNYKFVGESESMMAAASLLLAARMKKIESWNATMEYYTGYKESELEDLVVALNNNMRYTSNKSKTIYYKYNHKVFLYVGKIPLLDI